MNTQFVHKFKRSEDLGNQSLKYAEGKAPHSSVDKAAFHLLHDALDDMATGLLDLLGIEHPQSATVAESIALLGNHIPLPCEVTAIPGGDYNAILSGPFNKARWCRLRNAHKGLLFLTAGYGGDGEGWVVRDLLHLLERYPDNVILTALDCRSNDNHLGPLYEWDDHDKERARNVLRDRAKFR